MTGTLKSKLITHKVLQEGETKNKLDSMFFNENLLVTKTLIIIKIKP